MRALQLVSEREVKVTDVAPPPPPGEGEVQLKPRVVALEPHRCVGLARHGIRQTQPADDGGRRGLRQRWLQIGPGVTGLKTGDLVSIYGAPTCGLCRAMPARLGQSLRKPEAGSRLSSSMAMPRNWPTCRPEIWSPRHRALMTIGAALAPVTFGTVEHMLFDNAKLLSGETVLVHAGGSGIGSAAIQLAKNIGAHVITTVGSDDKIEKCLELGADHVINYREDRFEGRSSQTHKERRASTLSLNTSAPTPGQGSMLSMRRGGRLVTCGSTSGVSASTNLMQLFQQQLRLIGSFGCRMENLATAMEKMARGYCTSGSRHRDRVWCDIQTALERMESRKVFGKIIMRVNEASATG